MDFIRSSFGEQIKRFLICPLLTILGGKILEKQKNLV